MFTLSNCYQKYFNKAIGIMVFLLFIVACTYVHKQPIHSISLAPEENKLNLRIKLVITDDFRNAKWKKKSMGETNIMPMGENLVHHSIQLVKNVFTHPVVLDENVNSEADVGVEYILTPKLIFVKQTFGVTAFSRAKTSISIEWSLTDVSGKTTWVETINGEGIGKAGNIFTGKKHQKNRFKMALQDLFDKTQKAIVSSKLLRNLQLD